MWLFPQCQVLFIPELLSPKSAVSESHPLHFIEDDVRPYDYMDKDALDQVSHCTIVSHPMLIVALIALHRRQRLLGVLRTRAEETKASNPITFINSFILLDIF